MNLIWRMRKKTVEFQISFSPVRPHTKRLMRWFRLSGLIKLYSGTINSPRAAGDAIESILVDSFRTLQVICPGAVPQNSRGGHG